MNTLSHIEKKFSLNFKQRSPIEIPNFGRLQLVDLFVELGFKTGVEVGVATGYYSQKLNAAGLNVYGVDPFKPLTGYRDYTLQSTFKRLRESAHRKLEDKENYQFIYKTSMEAVREFDHNSLDFVYIDANHSLKFVIEDITEWSKRVRPGGIVAGHDYYRPKNTANTHVVEAIHAYTSAWKIHPWFVLGRQANDTGEIRDKVRSWMFVK